MHLRKFYLVHVRQIRITVSPNSANLAHMSQDVQAAFSLSRYSSRAVGISLFPHTLHLEMGDLCALVRNYSNGHPKM